MTTPEQQGTAFLNLPAVSVDASALEAADRTADLGTVIIRFNAAGGVTMHVDRAPDARAIAAVFIRAAGMLDAAWDGGK
jgi:hypothetical protein